MSSRPLPTYRQAVATCIFTALTALTCAALLSAAALVPAPPVVLPLIVTVCVVLPMVVACDSTPALAVLRASWSRRRLNERALGQLRRELDRLPETGHPLDR
jgi:peptidoglycan/LPS O-acetylase OafA/YrhL